MTTDRGVRVAFGLLAFGFGIRSARGEFALDRFVSGMDTTSPQLSQHTAAGAAAGIIYQFERMLHELIQHPLIDRIGIETSDDIEVQKKSHSELHQTKQSTSGYKPFRDNGVDLWKTLSNWARAIAKHEVNPGRTRFFLVTNRQVESGIATQISDAMEISEIEASLKSIRTHKPTASTKKFHKTVCDGTDDELKALIRQTTLLQAATGVTSVDDKDLLAKHLRITEDYDHEAILQGLLGWVVEQVQANWKEGAPGWISLKAFNAQLNRLRLASERTPFTVRAKHLLPVIDQDQINQHGDRPFIRQIEIVMENTADKDFYLEAVRDFLRASTERSRLAGEGRLTKDDFLAFDDNLQVVWKNIHARAKSNLAQYHSSEHCGREVYFSTMEVKERLANQETHPYFIHGSYHNLADSQSVGWHPDYKDKIT